MLPSAQPKPWRNDYSDGPVHEAFGLTYAAYAVFPRRCLQSMPHEWQERFIALVNEMHESLPEGALSGDYTVTMRVDGRIAKDPMKEYRHTGPLRLVRDGDSGGGGIVLTAYLLLAVWFFGVDMLAGDIAGSKSRPFAGAALALAWPLSAAFAIIGSAVIIGRMRATPPAPEGE